MSRRAQPAPDWAPPSRRRPVTWDDDLRGALAEDDEDRSAADDLLDAVLPQQLNWRRLVCDYPLPALAVAALGGYWLGRTRGVRILGALSAFAAANVAQAANDILGEELFDQE